MGEPRRSDGARVEHVAKLALIAGLYYGSAKLGLELAFATRSVTAIWPPTGIALTALVLWGPRMWPGVALGACLANGWTGVPLITVLGITCGNTLEAVVGAWLLRRYGRFRPSLARVGDVLALVVLAAVVSTTVSATIGVTSLLIGDEVAARDIPSVWRVWWLGDMGGDLLVAPLLMVLAAPGPLRRLPGSPSEAAALATSLAGVALFVFMRDTNVAYVVFPFLIWAALRFLQPGAVLASFLVAGIAVWFTQDGTGPFVRSNPDDSLLVAQTFVGVAGITALLLAAVMAERSRAEEEVGHIARTLQQSLLPTSLPEISGVDIAARFRPAGERHEVGGDFYDVFDAGGGGWAVVVGDVCGKGSEAAAVTGLARYTLRAAAMRETRPSAVLSVLNEAILHQRRFGEFCSVAYARLEVSGSTAQVSFATGGHPLPLVLRTSGKVEQVGRPGLLLGVLPDPDLAEVTLTLGPGDVLVLYTDGVTDAHAPARALRWEDVADVLATCRDLPAATTAERLETFAIGDGASVPRDDIALVVLRLQPGPTDNEGPAGAGPSIAAGQVRSL